MRHRFHVIGLPYVPTRKQFSACAFTARNWKFCAMMMTRGHEVYHYGLEGSDVACTRHATILEEWERQGFFGDVDQGRVHYTSTTFDWQPDKPYWQLMNSRAAAAIRGNLERQDFVCLIGGDCQKQIVDDLANVRHLFLPVEHGIGYIGTFAPHRVFDSYFHMARLYGREHNDPDGKNFDAVIPCPYDLDDFTFNAEPQDYYLFVGRIIDRKGVDIAVEATKMAGVRLVLCGQDARQVGNKIIATDGKEYVGDHLHYVGHVNVAARNEWMRNAKAILTPTKYLEPFGGVACEAQLVGTPAITSDWGAFPETVEHGVTGYRCRTLEQFVWAIHNAPQLNRKVVSDRARANYSMAKVGAMYEEYFDMLSTLWGQGWYDMRERTQLDWLVKQ